MMKRLIFVATLSLLSAPAFAQGSLEQPKTPDDGAGVDFTQLYMNDLLLRHEASPEPERVHTVISIPSCLPEFRAAKADPTDPDMRANVEACAARQKQALRDIEEMRKAMPAPGPKPPLFIPEPTRQTKTPRLPLSPNHPNAQN
ncbi:MAG: hypothetical protein EON93_18560 [Burkholderiales bacterium]|nr:MAG: hypothetical protein EON93_18560 [Burkholderiales bacterium]